MRLVPIAIMLALSLPSCISRRIAEKDVFYPVKLTSLSAALQLEDVTFVTDDSVHINGWFIRHPRAKGTILYSGGNGFALRNRLANDVINMLTSFQMNLLVFDYRGYGKSEGLPTLAGIRMDGQAALRYLRSRADVDSNRIVVYGHSLGTFVAIKLGISTPISAVILQNPLTNAPEMKDVLVKASVPWYARWLVQVDLDSTLLMLDNLNSISHLSVPLLIVTGENDALTPVEMGRKLYEAAASANKRFDIVPRADHNDIFFTNDQRKEHYVRTVAGFLDSVLH